MAGRYADIIAGMLGDEIVAGDDDFDLIAGLDDEDDDIVSGDDLALIAGALGKGKGGAAKKQLLRRAIAEKLSQGSTLVKQRSATKGRTVPLGFDSETAIDPGQTRRITTRPQIIFRGQRFVVQNDIAGAFIIQDLIVGKNSQFAASGPLPARAFESNAFGVELELDTAQIGQDITVFVTNTSSTPTRFVATLIGRSVE